MKRTILIVLLVAVVLFSCYAGGNKDEESSSQTETVAPTSGDALPADKDLSYAFGMALGTDMKQFGIDFDYDEFIKGFEDILEGNVTRIALEDAMTNIQTALTATMEKQMLEAQAVEEVFFTENGAKPGITTTASGLQYEVITPADGPKPAAEQTVVVHYQGTLIDGTVFDSSIQRNEPAEFPLNRVIPGWTEGMQLMSVGSKYRFYIPSYLGYGPQGAGGGLIPPFAPLIFEVELLEIK
jgi:FKBP-type peptidyl-prolyl cis-trans isomerase